MPGTSASVDRVDGVRTREARPDDAAAIAAIYNEGIDDRLATFETECRTPADVQGWLGAFPVVVAEDESGAVAAWASAPPSSSRPVYAGVREFSIYVSRSHRGRGFGRAAVAALVAECEARGFSKLVSRVFPENAASLALCRSLGFREVGVHVRHGRLDGEWRDVVVVEKLLGVD
jgi:L-amino acid N-acyltransferase YncA